MFGYCIVEMSGEQIEPSNANELNAGDELLVDGKKYSFMQFKVIQVSDENGDYTDVDLETQHVTRDTSGGRRRRTRRGRSRRARRGRSHRRR